MIDNATAAIEEQDKGLEDNTDSLMRHNNICDGEVEGREEAGDITISDDVDAGAKRRRGRPRKSFSSVHSNLAAVVDNCKEGLSNGDTVLDDIVMMSEPAKRGRGRPRKSPLENGDSSAGLNNPNNKKNSTGGAAARGKYAAIDEEVLVIGDSTAAKRGRGRPRKRPLQNGTSSGLGKDRKKGKLDRSDISPLERNLRYTSPPHSHEVHIQSNGEPATTDVVKDSPFMNAVVKVFCVHTEPNFSLPWQRKRQYSSNSSGFIIEGRRVLTNAHSVEHHTQVKLKKRGSDTKYLAKVLAIGTECDIAMLTVDDDEFWEDISPVQFGELPILQDAVTVVGYPIGGDTISVTSGVVSRIEVLSYVHGSTELLGLQIDAAINAGNSGGPAFSDKGQCVGIAFQSLKHEDAENIGYVIPTPVIRHFITDYERNNEYTGFPFLGIEWQKMENPDLRLAMKMKPNQKGVLIRRVEPTAPASRYLKPSDILLSVNGVDIANDGTVPFRHGERIGFTYLVSQKYTGEKAKVRILRDSFVNEFDIELSTQKRLVPAHTKGKPPSYYIIAGFVFSAVSVPYLRSEYGKDHDFDAPVKILDKLWYSLAQTEDEQLVVISQVLVADINIGYEDIVNTQVLAFNGVQVRNLKHLAQMVENCEDEFLRFDLEYQQVVVLSTKKSKEATKDILVTHCIPSAMSNDLII